MHVLFLGNSVASIRYEEQLFYYFIQTFLNPFCVMERLFLSNCQSNLWTTKSQRNYQTINKIGGKKYQIKIYKTANNNTSQVTLKSVFLQDLHRFSKWQSEIVKFGPLTVNPTVNNNIFLNYSTCSITKYLWNPISL